MSPNLCRQTMMLFGFAGLALAGYRRAKAGRPSRSARYLVCTRAANATPGLHSLGSSDVTPRQRGMTVVCPSSSIIIQRRPLLSSK